MLKERAKYAVAVAAPVVMSSMAMMTSYASETESGSSITDSVTNSLVGAVTEIATSVGDAIGKVIPVALPLIGAGLVVTVGIKIFKKVTSQA